MPSVPLGVEAYNRAASFQPETRLVNLYIEEDKSGASPDEIMRLQRPGMVRTVTFDAPVRGIYQADNTAASSLPLIVAGTTVYSVDGTMLASLGNVPDDGKPVSIAGSFERSVIVSGGEAWQWDGTTFSQLAMPDGVAIIDVDVLNGYFIFPEASGTFYWLEPGSTTEDPLDYATAEALPDGVNAVRRLRDELFFFGTESIEVWQATGDADATFSRAPGRQIDRGCMSRDTVVVFDNTLVFVGDDGIVYRISDVPKRISTFGIEERLRKREGVPSAFQFTTFGHKFYCLRIPGSGTFAFDPATGGWCEFSSVQSDGWLAVLGRDTPNRTLVADDAGGLYTLDPEASTDDGVPFVRLVTGTIAVPAMPVANSSFSVGVGSAAAVPFSIRWNDPHRGWSNPIARSSRGGGDVLTMFRLGLCRAPYRSFEISCVADAQVRISGAVANEGWRV